MFENIVMSFAGGRTLGVEGGLGVDLIAYLVAAYMLGFFTREVITAIRLRLSQ